MQRIKFGKKALLSFIIFLIVITKDILVSNMHIIPVRSPINRLISWLVILPLTIIGGVITFQIFKMSYLQRKNGEKPLITINLLLSLPLGFCFLYFLLEIVFAFF